MKVIVCLDDRGGMMFNRRRQSRDRVLCEDVIKNETEGRLLIAPYSVPLFEGFDRPPTVDDDFLLMARRGDTCFVEDRPLAPWLDRIERLVIYRWNRQYPADLRFDLEPEQNGFRLTEHTEFAGSSHETITKEIFER